MNHEEINIHSSAVQAYLQMLQGVIDRMARNSATCKNFCITLVGVIAALSKSGQSPNAIWVALLPIAIFVLLDGLYLSLEKGFRKTYADFVDKLHKGEAKSEDIFRIAPPPGYSTPKQMLEACRSWSVWLLYGALLILLFVVRVLI